MNLSAQTDICDKANLPIEPCKYEGGIYCALAARNLLGCRGAGEELLAFLLAVKGCFDGESNGCNVAGIIMMRENKIDNAEVYFKKALAAKEIDNIKKADALYNLACIYSKRGKLQEALNYLKKASSSNPKSLEHSKTDEDIKNLRDMEEYRKLIKVASPKQ
jgi:tetratricopeptide (TPR) repeat protein